MSQTNDFRVDYVTIVLDDGDIVANISIFYGDILVHHVERQPFFSVDGEPAQAIGRYVQAEIARYSKGEVGSFVMQYDFS